MQSMQLIIQILQMEYLTVTDADGITLKASLSYEREVSESLSTSPPAEPLMKRLTCVRNAEWK